jgi:alkaline phosphatase D
MKWNMLIIIFIWLGPHLSGQEFSYDWNNCLDRVWAGKDFWANRLQDWRVFNGRLECVEDSEDQPMRTVHLLSHRLSDQPGGFLLSVNTGIIGKSDKTAEGAESGFLIGCGARMDYRSAAIIQKSHGPDGGLFAGINSVGDLFIRDFETNIDMGVSKGSKACFQTMTMLQLIGIYSGKQYELHLSYYDSLGNERNSLVLKNVQPQRLSGNMALVSNPGKGPNTGRFWFNHWEGKGKKILELPGPPAGPIISTQYTLSEKVLNLTAQLMPVSIIGDLEVDLEIMDTAGGWKKIAAAKVYIPGFTASFRVQDWDDSKDIPFRVKYDIFHPDGSNDPHYWYGTIRKDPAGKDEIILAAFACVHQNQRSFENPAFAYDWYNKVYFPHQEVVDHVLVHQPDLLFFSGDQVYDNLSPTWRVEYPLDKAELDYLYKWYLWCWTFRDLTKDIPAVIIPDDHDVFHGNLWGAGGRSLKIMGSEAQNQLTGGYLMPASWVRMVERTQTSHLPDPYDPEFVKQGIGTYYTSMRYGGVSFAILEDRKFKTGPSDTISEFSLLGDRQLDFIEHWTADWEGAEMKVVLHQSPFADISADLKLLEDKDSNGWPPTERDKAIKAIRKGFAFMIAGDQHLGSVIQHGLDDWNDSGWEFSVPAVANFYARQWRPGFEGHNHIEGMPGYTGEYADYFNNKVTVWAIANPEPVQIEPVYLHSRAPGYGIIRFDKPSREITMECWPRYVDPDDASSGSQYPGWPKTVSMEGNYSRKAYGFLPELNVHGIDKPVVQLVCEENREIIYTLRLNNLPVRLKVFEPGSYSLIIGEPETGKMKSLENIRPVSKKSRESITVDF